jgi:TonB-linked SusC/RagA family outer membrane protein
MKQNFTHYLIKTRWRFLQMSFVLGVLISMSFTAMAQEKIEISGVVTSQTDKQTMPGVSIVIKGTTNGTITDIDGKFSIKASIGETLVFSYIGFVTEEYVIADAKPVQMAMAPDLVGLDEVVVVGYGVQKKKLNTGATVNVKGEDIEKLNTTSPMDALKGISAGVTITQNNGVPGSGAKILIRGAGTIGDPDPLYIVDGVAVDNINHLSPNDIESIDVLKDAASAAIYGSRAANGVILVTTKKGVNGAKATITYDFYNGWQYAYKVPHLLNAQEYMNVMDSAYAHSKRPAIKWATMLDNYDQLKSGEDKGTNWWNEIYKAGAQTQSHAINITGGSETSTYSMGYSNIRQEGILCPQVNNVYKRMNFRLNSDHIVIKEGGRNILKIGENLNYTNYKNPSVRTGNIYWNDLHNALVTSPVLPMYAKDSTDLAYPYHYVTGWNDGEINPVADMIINNKHSENNNNQLFGNVYGELEPISKLVLRSSFGVNSWWGHSRSWVPEYNLGPRTFTDRDKVSQSMYSGYTWTSTNTISYNFKVLEDHNFTTLIGHEVSKTATNLSLSGSNQASIFNDWEHAYLHNFTSIDPTYTTLDSKDTYGDALLSYFGRVSYDFRETILATFVMRADASTMFPKENRWGYFPSASLGYVLTNNSFMQGVPYLNYLKIRGSYGENGNQNITAFQYNSSLTYEQADYFFGTDKTVRFPGAYPERVPNPNIKWETSKQTSLGFDANFFDNKLQWNFDLYKKVTDGWLVLAPALQSYGTNPAYINGGNVENKGFESVIRWNEKRGDFSYGVNFSLAYNKNEITAIANEEKIIHGPSSVISQGTSEMYRAEVGHPIGYFWGYKTDGIMKNQNEADAWVNSNGNKYFKDQTAGDIRFANTNGDTLINDLDKVQLGKPNPDFVFGLQLDAEYKGFYAQVALNGMTGLQVAKSYRSFADSPKQNYMKEDVDNTWNEYTNPNGKLPRLLATSHRNYQYVSDLYIEDADFVRISNITVGYDIKYLWKGMPLQQARIYFSGKNLLTITKYSGLDPEVGYGPDSWASGIDLGMYPSSKMYMIGLSAKF